MVISNKAKTNNLELEKSKSYLIDVLIEDRLHDDTLLDGDKCYLTIRDEEFLVSDNDNGETLVLNAEIVNSGYVGRPPEQVFNQDPEVVVNEEIRRAFRFKIQANQLNLDPDIDRWYDITYVRQGYSAVVCKGTFKVLLNSTNRSFGDTFTNPEAPIKLLVQTDSSKIINVELLSITPAKTGLGIYLTSSPLAIHENQIIEIPGGSINTYDRTLKVGDLLLSTTTKGILGVVDSYKLSGIQISQVKVRTMQVFGMETLKLLPDQLTRNVVQPNANYNHNPPPGFPTSNVPNPMWSCPKVNIFMPEDYEFVRGDTIISKAVDDNHQYIMISQVYDIHNDELHCRSIQLTSATGAGLFNTQDPGLIRHADTMSQNQGGVVAIGNGMGKVQTATISRIGTAKSGAGDNEVQYTDGETGVGKLPWASETSGGAVKKDDWVSFNSRVTPTQFDEYKQETAQMVSDETNARVTADESLRTELTELVETEATARDEADDVLSTAIEDARDFAGELDSSNRTWTSQTIASAVLATHHWLPSVMNYEDLPTSVPRTDVSYLIRVINPESISGDGGQGVYQHISNGYYDASWTFYAMNEDWINVSEMKKYWAAAYNSQHIGEVKMWAGNTLPTGWLLCDGSSKSRTTYDKLYNVIGTQYGGSGSTFNLPDMSNSFPIGNTRSSKNTGGSTVTLTTANLPSHSHSLDAHSHSIPNHNHSIPDHNHTVPNHSHYMQHSHDMTHTHEMNHNHGTGTTSWHNGQRVTVGLTAWKDSYSDGSGNTNALHTTALTGDNASRNINVTLNSSWIDGHSHTMDIPDYTGLTGYPKDQYGNWMWNTGGSRDYTDEVYLTTNDKTGLSTNDKTGLVTNSAGSGSTGAVGSGSPINIKPTNTGFQFIIFAGIPDNGLDIGGF
jgi:microcystin-dependent protein